MPTRKSNPRKRKSRRERGGESEQAPTEASEQAASEVAAPPEPATAAERPSQPTGPRRNPRFPVGVNYYPLDAEAQPAEQAYAGDIPRDFAAFADAHFALVRVFVSWKAIEPEVAQYEDTAVDRIAKVLKEASQNGIRAIVCFFADDRSGELLDVPWGKRRDPRTDSYLIQREAAFVQMVVTRFRSEKAVFAWDLANEAFCAGFESSADLTQWARIMRGAIREVDEERPITLGVDPEALFRETAVDAREAVGLMDFGVSHVTSEYRAYAAGGPLTSGPATYLPAFLLHAARRNAPVLLDDVGPVSLDASVAEEAAYLRSVLWSGFMNRAAGVLAARYRDLETERREPYFVDPFERLVGIADHGGRPKPSLGEMRRFGSFAAHIDLGHYGPTRERAAVLLPEERYEAPPNLAALHDPRACLHSFIGMKQAHVAVGVVRAADDLRDWQMLVVPSALSLDEAMWERLAVFVRSGGALVLSYGGGDMPPIVREIFGVEFLGDGGARDMLSCRVAQADLLGELANFDVVFPVENFALLSATGATVVATDQGGDPLLTVNRSGRGRAVFVAVPMERAIAQNDPWATPVPVSTMLRSVYGAVARPAGCASPVSCDAPQVEIAVLQGDTDDVVLLLNHASKPTDATLSCGRRVASVTDVRGGAAVPIDANAFSVPIKGNGASALRLAYA